MIYAKLVCQTGIAALYTASDSFVKFSIHTSVTSSPTIKFLICNVGCVGNFLEKGSGFPNLAKLSEFRQLSEDLQV